MPGQKVKNYFRLLAEDKARGIEGKLMVPVIQAASFFYQLGGNINRACYDKGYLKRKKFPVPVVSVGNLTWGGTGKTPLVEYLARKIGERGKSALVLTRGYNHDEVEQFKNHLPKAIIGAGKNRVEIAEKELHEKPVDVIILDDGFQHQPIVRDVEVVTINSLNPFGNEHLIPRGILREPIQHLSKAHLVVLSNTNLLLPAELEKVKEKIYQVHPKAKIVETYLEPLFFYRSSNHSRIPLEKMVGQKVTTFAGLAAPRSFQMTLSRLQMKTVRNFEFMDHHQYTEQELHEIKRVSESASAEIVITTEKDFYRDPVRISKILNPLILATRLRVRSGESYFYESIFRLFEGSSSGKQ